MFPRPLCDKMFPALVGQTLKIPFLFKCGPTCITAIIMATAVVRPGLGLLRSFKALNQSALMDDPDSSMHVWISLTGAPVPVLSTTDQVTAYTFTWLTQLPVIDNMPAFSHCTPSQ